MGLWQRGLSLIFYACGCSFVLCGKIIYISNIMLAIVSLLKHMTI